MLLRFCTIKVFELKNRHHKIKLTSSSAVKTVAEIAPNLAALDFIFSSDSAYNNVI